MVIAAALLEVRTSYCILRLEVRLYVQLWSQDRRIGPPSDTTPAKWGSFALPRLSAGGFDADLAAACILHEEESWIGALHRLIGKLGAGQ